MFSDESGYVIELFSKFFQVDDGVFLLGVGHDIFNAPNTPLLITTRPE